MRGLWICLVLAGCAASASKRTEDLVSDARAFQEGLRWRRYEEAAQLVPASVRAAFLDAHEEIDDDLRIDDYEIERVTLAADALHATVRVRFTWHLDSVGTVHETLLDELWERQGKIWRILGTEHRRGPALPPDALPAAASAVAPDAG